jgi:HPt (histidine-containing phosphotransfer) domain-containing protein
VPPSQGAGGEPAAAAMAGIAAVAEVHAPTVLGLKSLRGGQSDLYTRLVDLFRASSAKSIEEIQTALDAQDLSAAASSCHKLGSSAGNVGAFAFARYVRQMEKLCNEREAARAIQIYQTVRAAHPALIEELMRLQLEESA